MPEGALFDLSGILTTENEMSIFYQIGQLETFRPLFRYLNSKKA